MRRAAVLLAGIGALLLGPGSVGLGQAPTTPDFRGMTVDEARDGAAAAGLPASVLWQVRAGHPGRVIGQSPRAGEPTTTDGSPPSVILYASTGYRRTLAAREFRTTGGEAYCQLETAGDFAPSVVCWSPRHGIRLIVSSIDVGTTSPRRDIHTRSGTGPPASARSATAPAGAGGEPAPRRGSS